MRHFLKATLRNAIIGKSKTDQIFKTTVAIIGVVLLPGFDAALSHAQICIPYGDDSWTCFPVWISIMVCTLLMIVAVSAYLAWEMEPAFQISDEVWVEDTGNQWWHCRVMITNASKVRSIKKCAAQVVAVSPDANSAKSLWLNRTASNYKGDAKVDLDPEEVCMFDVFRFQKNKLEIVGHHHCPEVQASTCMVTLRITGENAPATEVKCFIETSPNSKPKFSIVTRA